ncbi:MAG TPA: serine/threonine-protein kinase, partial [Polyangiaceae bacterium]|nr:serine/threonine-protein kinase [Polyangiaceae bacterium]
MSDVERNASSPRIPAIIGRYEIVCKLGVGGMADVFLAHQPGPFSASKLVVIKQLRPGVLEDDQFIHMFADESRIAVRLNHPNVIHTYEVVAEGSDYYLTLEFLDGKSWYQVLNRVTRERLPLDLHVWVLTQVLSGLQYAHELKDFDGTPLGIVHRDVSPSNVFVTYGGEVKLLDFGIAKSASAIASTRDGIIKGKLGYAAPEQCLSQSIDGRTDVFAVGVMLWEAIARRRRSTGETESGTYQARIQGTEPSIDQVCSDAPKALVAACNKALARTPEQRFQSAVEFRQALEDYLRGTGWVGGSERLGQFMHENFQDDFVAMRQRIDEHLGSSARSLTSSHREFSDQVTEQGPTATRSGSAAFAQVSSSSVRAQPASRVNHRARTIGFGLLAVLAAVGGGLYQYSSSQRQPQTHRNYAASVASPHAPHDAAPQANAESPPAAQPVGQVTVALIATPST